MELLSSNTEISQFIECLLPELTAQIHQDEQERLNSQIQEQLHSKKEQLRKIYNAKLQEEIQKYNLHFNQWYDEQTQQMQLIRQKQEQRREEEYQISPEEEDLFMKRVLSELVDDNMFKDIKNTLSKVIDKNISDKYALLFVEQSKKIKKKVQDSYEEKKQKQLSNYQKQLVCKTEESILALEKERQRIEEEKSNIKARVQKQRQEHAQAKEKYQITIQAYNSKIQQMRQQLKQLKQRF